MARTVSDVAFLLSVLAGPDPRCPISISEPGSRFTGNLDRNFKGARVAWFNNMGGIPFAARILKVVNAQRKAFESLGRIVEASRGRIWTGAHESYDALRAWGYATNQAENVRQHRDLVKDTILWEVEARIEAVRQRYRTGVCAAQPGVGPHAGLSGEIRILHHTHNAGPAVRYHSAVPHRNRGREDVDLH